MRGAAPALSAILVENGGTPPAGGTTVDLSGGGATGGSSRYADRAAPFEINAASTATNTAPTSRLPDICSSSCHTRLFAPMD